MRHFITTILFLSVALRALGEVCPADLTVTGPDANGDFTITGSTEGRTCGEANLYFSLDGTIIESKFCNGVTGTIKCEHTFKLSQFCRLPGNRTISLSTECKFSDTTTCGVETWGQDGSATAPITIPSADPTASVSGYNAATGMLTLSYSFPNTNHPTSRSLQINVDNTGWYPAPNECKQNVSGTCTFQNTLPCGTRRHKIDLWARSCGKDEAEFNEYSTGYATAAACPGTKPRKSCNTNPGAQSNCPKVNNACPIGGSSGGTQPPCPASVNGCAGPPTHAGTGEVTATIPLFTIDQPPAPFTFELSYHSLPLDFPPSNEITIGKGWSHPYGVSLRSISPLTLQLMGSDGEPSYFEELTTGLWTPVRPATALDQITKQGANYVLSFYGGGNAQFDMTTGRWISTTDRWGNTTSATYDASGVLSALVDSVGRQYTFAYRYDYGPQITSITLPDGNVWRFEYNGHNLSAIYDPLHTGATPWRTITYDMTSNYPRLLEIKDDAGKVIEGHTYDASGRGLTSYAQGGRDELTFEYDTPTTGKTRVTKRIDGATTQVSVYTMETVAEELLASRIDGVCPTCGTAQESLSHTFDTMGRLLTQTDAGGSVTRYTYDASGNIVTVTEAYGTSRARTTTFTYGDASWPGFATQRTIPSVVSGLKTTTYAWSQNNTILTTTESGSLGPGAGTTTHTTTTTFDSRHRVLSTNGPRTDVTDTITNTYYSDTDVDVLRRGRLANVTNGVGHATSFDEYNLYGTARKMTDANGVVLQLVTDARGRVTTSTSKTVTGDPNETTDYVSTSTYDTRDRLIETVSPRGNKTRYRYEDGTNRLTDTILINASNQEVERKHLTLNLVGQVTLEEDQVCSTPATTCSSWVTKRSESFGYDDKGRLTTVTHPIGGSIAYTYDTEGRIATTRDENHASPNTTNTYDELDRLSSVTQTLSGAPGGTVTTSYTYDVHDNLTSVTDPNGNTTSYQYDDFGRMTKQTSPVTGITTYTHDASGNLTSTTDANGATTTRTYDVLSRPLTTTSTATAKPTETVTYTYDSATSGNYGVGRLATINDPTGSTAYAYERRGLLRRETKTVNGTIYTTLFTYDADGNRNTIASPSARTTTYTYDYANRPITASNNGTSLVSAATYLPFGPLTSMTLGNGTTVTRTYDQRYRPTMNKLASAGGTIAQYDYTYDNSGNITGITDATNAAYNRTFAYDDLHRLTTANSGSALWGTGGYTYDRMGNMLTATLGTRSTTFTYSGTTPKLTSVTDPEGARSVTYDSAGNEATVGTNGYAYTSRNSLLTGDFFEYAYDGRGIRTITTVLATPVSISSVTFSPASVTGAGTATGTITLSANAPASGLTVYLASGNQSAANVPPRVTIAAGATSATFTVTTNDVQTPTPAAIRAALGGNTTTGTLTVDPTPPVVTSLSLNPTTVNGGNSSTATVTLNKPAFAGGTSVSLSSSSSAATVPASVTVPAGSTSTTFTVSTLSATNATSATITATLGGSQSAVLTINVTPVLTSITLSPSSVIGGRRNATATATLNVAAPPGGAVVSLSSSNTSAATVPASISIPQGASSGMFTVTSATVSADTSVTITGIYGATQTATLTVWPCSAVIPAPVSFPSGDVVWFDDAIPAGATPYNTWIWDTNQKASGTQSSTAGIVSGGVYPHFTNASPGLALNANDKLVTYALIDDCNRPRQLLLEFYDGTNWKYAHWGENLINLGGAPSLYMGPVPAGGSWVRLEVPVGSVGLAGKTITGWGNCQYDGRVWWDRAGKMSCTVPTASAPTLGNETVWFDDALPAGASGIAPNPWLWDTSQKASGTQSHTDTPQPGWTSHSFDWSTSGLAVNSGDVLVAYAAINPCAVPREIRIWWTDGTWYLYYWGDDTSTYSPRVRVGDIPTTTGAWIRLEMPASLLGLAGKTMRGISLAVPGGQVWFDRIGKQSGSSLQGPMFSSATEAEAPKAKKRNRLSRALERLKRTFTKKSNSAAPISFSMSMQLVETTAAGDPRRYSFYTPELSLLAETGMSTATSPTTAYDYVWFNGQPLAQLNNATGETSYYFNDHLGTPILQTSSTGAVVWRVEREPYGKNFTTRVGGDRHQPLAFPGQEDHGSSDRNYNIFRWYRSSWGRYTQSDPIGLAASLNLYAYVDGNPVTFSDPRGLVKVDSSCKGFGDCGCDSAIDKAAKDFNDFWKPGWGQRKPKCRQKLIDMAKTVTVPSFRPPYTNPSPYTPITCMSKLTEGMTVRCSKIDAGGFGGPPLNTMYNPNIIWLQPNACANKNDLLDTIFHEALHNCGAPPDAGPFAGQRMAYDITATCLGGQ